MSARPTPNELQQLFAGFLSGRNQRTVRAYRADLESFRDFLHLVTVEESVRQLLRRGHGEANALAYSYRAFLVERGLSPATVNRRLSAVRSLVKRARALGIVPWTIEVSNVKTEPYRDTRGPGRDGFLRMMRVLSRRSGAKG